MYCFHNLTELGQAECATEDKIRQLLPAYLPVTSFTKHVLG